MPRIVDLGRTRLLVVPGAAGIADYTAPTTTELTAVGVRDVTCMMVSTYEVRMDASDTTNERAVCETNNVVTPTIGNYMGRMELFRDWDTTPSPDWAETDVLEWLAYLDTLWFVRRNGLPYDTAWANGQTVEVYKFIADNVQTSGGTGSGFMKATVPLLPQGVATTTAVIGGAGS